MKTNVSDTSIKSIHALRQSGGSLKQREIIIDTLYQNIYAMTNGEIAKETGIEKCAISGRVNGLVRDGVVERVNKRQCSVSNVTCWTIQLSKKSLES